MSDVAPAPGCRIKTARKFCIQGAWVEEGATGTLVRPHEHEGWWIQLDSMGDTKFEELQHFSDGNFIVTAPRTLPTRLILKPKRKMTLS